MDYLNNANDASGASIFIVEDDAVLRDELANLLELNGYEVHCCKDFAHAAQEALADDFDCVILDLTLPGTNGHAICRAIRAKSEVPIIVLTSATDEFHEVMSLNLRCSRDWACSLPAGSNRSKPPCSNTAVSRSI